MNEKLLIFLLILGVTQTPYPLYLLYKSKFKTVGAAFMRDVSDLLSGHTKVNHWSFDARFSVAGGWNGYPVMVTLGTGCLDIQLVSNELPKLSNFLFKYPVYKDGIIHVGNRLHKSVRSSQIWAGKYDRSTFLSDLEALIQIHDEITGIR